MGLMDNFAAEDRLEIKFSTLHALDKAAAKSELLQNAINNDVPHKYIRGMLYSLEEYAKQAEFRSGLNVSAETEVAE